MLFHEVLAQDAGRLLAFGISPGPPEMLLLAVIALLLYGGKLPEVARSWGRTLTEFRRNLADVRHEIDDAIYNEPQQLPYHGDDLDAPTADYPVQDVDDASPDEVPDDESVESSESSTSDTADENADDNARENTDDSAESTEPRPTD